jgi:hypothetical protein
LENTGVPGENLLLSKSMVPLFKRYVVTVLWWTNQEILLSF